MFKIYVILCYICIAILNNKPNWLYPSSFHLFFEKKPQKTTAIKNISRIFVEKDG